MSTLKALLQPGDRAAVILPEENVTYTHTQLIGALSPPVVSSWSLMKATLSTSLRCSLSWGSVLGVRCAEYFLHHPH